MRNRVIKFFADEKSDESISFLLSQELDFEFSKSMLTFSLAFIGGIVTLSTALDLDKPYDDSFQMAIISSALAAIWSFLSQQGIIEDLRKKRVPSELRRLLRGMPSALLLGLAFGSAARFFNFAPSVFG